MPTTPDEYYWKALDNAMAYTVPRPTVLVVNYPSNPTAETVDLAFYERLVAWARENKVWVLSDLAYSELYYDGKPTRSILEVPGAKDVAVEFTSMSKTYSMAGWRMGFAVGNPTLISALSRVKRSRRSRSRPPPRSTGRRTWSRKTARATSTGVT